MERFYVFQLLSFIYKYVGYLRIAKYFLYSGWNIININVIQESSLKNEYYMKSIQNANIFIL